MPSPAVEATCDGAVAVPRAGKPCGKAGSMSRLCSKGSILPLDFLSTQLVINSQGDRKGTPVQYTNAIALAYIVRAYPCGRPGNSGNWLDLVPLRYFLPFDIMALHIQVI